MQVWLIGTGIPSLAAAVHLICDANVRGSQIHILEVDSRPGHKVESHGDQENGYHLHMDFSPRVIEGCTAELFSRIPVQCLKHNSLLECFVAQETRSLSHGHPDVGFVYWEDEMRTSHCALGLKDRKNILKFMLDCEQSLDSKRIDELFNQSFFGSDLWHEFSARFGLQPWHSAVEFHRYLYKYVEPVQRGEIKTLVQARYSTLAWVQQRIEQYLRYQGVNFEFGTVVSNLKMLPEHDPTYVSVIECIKDRKQRSIQIGLDDIVIATLGSITSGSLLGCNSEPPPPISYRVEKLLNGYWSLWFRLAKQSPKKFGNPGAFCTHLPESKMETFTVTMMEKESKGLCAALKNLLGENKILSVSQSNWLLCISLPHQPVFPDQPKGTCVFWGYGLSPAAQGNFIRKPMSSCSGEEILFEILTHLGFPFNITSTAAVTVPCLMPLATSALLNRSHGDRPEVIPLNTTNMALIGQFSEIKEEAALSLEYAVRSAQLAVNGLMGLAQCPPKVKRNVLVDRYGKHS